MSQRHILFLGASGYIGGTVLHRFLNSADAAIKTASYTALVRTQEQASKLAALNVKSIVFRGIDDTELLRKQASEHDIVVNAADAFNTEAAKALIQGLSEGQKKSGTEAIYLHTSGTSSVGDYPVPAEAWVISDKDDVYARLTQLEGKKPYAQRTTDVAVVDTGLATNVKTFILMSPTIYGKGSGLFHTRTNQVPGFITRALKRGKTAFLYTGAGDWDHVHVDDLADLYELILRLQLHGEAPPSGRQGIYFNETGHHNWKALAEKVAAIGKELGALRTSEVEGVEPEEWLAASGGPPTPPVVQAHELGFASWSRTVADQGRSIGWAPKHGDESWEEFTPSMFKDIMVERK